MKKLIILAVILTLIVSIVFAQSRRSLPAEEGRYLTSAPGTQFNDTDNKNPSQQKPIRKKTTPQRLDEIETRLDEITARLDRIEEKLFPEKKLIEQGQATGIRFPLEVGQIFFFFDDNTFQVQQIIDKQNMIVELNALGKSTTVWLRGFDTSKYADDSIIKPASDQVFKITGTQQYDATDGGTKTLFVMEPYISQEKK
jgi:hypothetical protein